MREKKKGMKMRGEREERREDERREKEKPISNNKTLKPYNYIKFINILSTQLLYAC
ncbi:hypothetical protein BVRB_2g027980 [Beta vulgaris subsp. vulgaris]|nr:hypothetical protein BVRB_2g027980 [Beta vulgaris subsp. vulgaris]